MEKVPFLISSIARPPEVLVYFRTHKHMTHSVNYRPIFPFLCLFVPVSRTACGQGACCKIPLGLFECLECQRVGCWYLPCWRSAAPWLKGLLPAALSGKTSVRKICLGTVIDVVKFESLGSSSDGINETNMDCIAAYVPGKNFLTDVP